VEVELDHVGALNWLFLLGLLKQLRDVNLLAEVDSCGLLRKSLVERCRLLSKELVLSLHEQCLLAEVCAREQAHEVSARNCCQRVHNLLVLARRLLPHDLLLVTRNLLLDLAVMPVLVKLHREWRVDLPLELFELEGDWNV